MDDFEKFENELNEHYSNYVLKFRILSYLEKELEGHFRNQREKVQVNRDERNVCVFTFELVLGSFTAIYATYRSEERSCRERV